MRVIRLELPAVLTSADPEISLASDEIRGQLFREIAALDYELGEMVRARAASYFPATYSVFVRSRLEPERTRMVAELWIVDPTVTWPRGLLARSAWRLFVPILSHVVQEVFQARLARLRVEMSEKDARVTVLAPTRGWRDPIVLSVAVAVLTSIYWLAIHASVRRTLGAMLGL